MSVNATQITLLLILQLAKWQNININITWISFAEFYF